jgi:iron complex transport system substrate-binding protein
LEHYQFSGPVVSVSCSIATVIRRQKLEAARSGYRSDQRCSSNSGIGWVSELVEVAGGVDIFADRRNQGAAKDRVVTAEEVIAREPDLIIDSWCGKKFRSERVMARAGFGQIPAVRHQDLYEIKSSLILQPGPAALIDGLAKLQRIVQRWAIRDNAHCLD